MAGDLKEYIEAVATSDPVARKISRAQKLDKRLGELAAGVVVDDGIPPANPTGGAVAIRVRALVVTWDPPDPDDFVAYTVVSVENPPGTPVATKNVSGSGVTVAGLVAGTAYTVKLKHVDRWAHESSVVTIAGTYAPTATVADSVDPAVIITGTLAAHTITMGAGGTISAGGARIDDTGVHVVNEFTSRDGMWPGSVVADWISGPVGTHPSGSGTALPYAGMAFFNQASPSFRGVVIEAMGVVTGSIKSGNILIRATDGATTGMQADTQTVYIDMQAGVSPDEGDIFIKGNTQYFDDLIVNGAFTATGTVDLSSTAQWMTGGYKEVSLGSGGSWGIQTVSASVKRIANFAFVSGRYTNTSGSTNNPGSVICSLGADFTPSQDKVFVVARTSGGSYTEHCRVRVKASNGDVVLEAAGGGSANDVNTGQAISLDNLVFALNN